MKIHKNLILFILIILIILISMTIISRNKSGTRYQNSIFNDENKIIKEADSFSYGEKLGNVKGNKIDIKFNSFSGMDTICDIIADEESNVVFNFESIIEKGNFKVVVITPDDKIIDILNDTEEGSETILLKQGISKLKFIGKKSNGETKINVNSKSEVEIKEISFWD